MLSNLGPSTLLLIVVVCAVAHALLLGLSFRWHPLWLLAGSFLVLAPLSQAIDLPGHHLLKYARVYVTLLMVVVGMFCGAYRLRAASLMFMVFVTVYAMGAIWSEHVVAAIKYKGLYWLLALAGIMVANTVHDRFQCQRMIRVLFAGFAVYLLLIQGGMLASPSSLLAFGRLSVLGMNPNLIGGDAAMAALVSLYIYFFDPRQGLRWLGLGCAIAAGALIFYTGSRGAAGTALVGCGLILLPVVKSPGRLLTFLVLAGIGFFGISELTGGTDMAGRFADFSLDTRLKDWTHNIWLIQQKPLYGHGWVGSALENGRVSTINMLSIYMQVLAETGILGFTCMLGVLGFVGMRALRVYRTTFPGTFDRSVLNLAVAYVFATLANGVVETGPITGSTTLAFMLALGVGLIDVTKGWGDQTAAAAATPFRPVTASAQYLGSVPS